LIVFELTGSENHPAYQELEIANGLRQYDFLRSMVAASLGLGRPFLSQQLLKALNFHSIACLHTSAGEFRPCQVYVGNYEPPAHYRVQAQMDDFINLVNRNWKEEDPVVLAAFVLWKLNHIHPFINGNGRTARAACYFVLCVTAGGWLKGKKILPELLQQNRDEYIAALKVADNSVPTGKIDLSVLHNLISRLLENQMSEANNDPSIENGVEQPQATTE
jgi:fido (protein-threonine AMPylation protein)